MSDINSKFHNPMTVTEQKKDLRKQMLIKRAKLPKSAKVQYDQWICDLLLDKIENHDFKTIHCYLPLGDEINIFPLVENLLEKGLTVVTPKTLPKRKLKNLVLKSLNELEKGIFGTVHPAGGDIYIGEYDLIIVPGLSFDRNNYRLGYGGGYYDNFMVNHLLAKTVGIFYPFQEVEKIPTEDHDIKLDEVLIGELTLDN
ncbi:MAG: 5-formyltetrahydrofolate cyclo-ligase [Saprospiraceae bacterium]